MTTSTVPLPIYPSQPDAEPARQSALYHRGWPRPVRLRRVPNHEPVPTHLLEEGDVPRWFAVKAGYSLSARHHPVHVAQTTYTDESSPPDLALVLSDIRRPWREWHVGPRTEVCLVFAWTETDARQAYWTDRRERRQAS